MPPYLKSVVMYVFPAVAGLGIIFNALSIATMLNNSIRNTSQGLHLTMLSVADIVCLILSMSENWALPVWSIQFPPLRLCNFKLFSYFFFTFVSSLSIVCVATNCFLAVQFRLKAKILTTRRTAIIVLVAITFLWFGFCLPLLFTVQKNCDIQPDLFTFVTAHYTISRIVSFTGPFCYLLVVNSALVFRLARPTTQFMAMYNAKAKKSKKLTVWTIVLVSFSFVVCHALDWVVTCVQAFHSGVIQDARKWQVIYIICRLLLLVHHSVNFLFYIALSVNFRNSLKDIFKGKCLRNEAPPESAIALDHFPRRVCFRRTPSQEAVMPQWKWSSSLSLSPFFFLGVDEVCSKY